MDQIDRHVTDWNTKRLSGYLCYCGTVISWNGCLGDADRFSQKQLEEKQRDLELIQLKYNLGMIPMRSMQPGAETLESAQKRCK